MWDVGLGSHNTSGESELAALLYFTTLCTQQAQHPNVTFMIYYIAVLKMQVNEQGCFFQSFNFFVLSPMLRKATFVLRIYVAICIMCVLGGGGEERRSTNYTSTHISS